MRDHGRQDACPHENACPHEKASSAIITEEAGEFRQYVAVLLDFDRVQSGAVRDVHHTVRDGWSAVDR